MSKQEMFDWGYAIRHVGFQVVNAEGAVITETKDHDTAIELINILIKCKMGEDYSEMA